MIITLTGKSSHDAQPLEGISPALAVASLISYFNRISKLTEGIMATLIHVNISEITFGTSPDNATVVFTLRAPTTPEMKELSQVITHHINRTSRKEGFQYTINWAEEFPATVNAEQPNSIIQQTAEQLCIETIVPERPFPWSEDFGHFTEKYPGALFGLGAGVHTPPLHSPNYDFPDELIPAGVEMFKGIIERSLKL